jgi:uncharacterized protein YndB with AHSA1/START domain
MTIRKSITVQQPPEVSFRVFTEEVGAWWPGGFGGKDIKMCMDRRVGGRFYELNPDGTEYEIGRIIAFQPPSVVAFTWRAPSWDTMTTEVEVRFIKEGAGTRIELEHRGWEQDEKLIEARKSYDEGWVFVLGHYQKHADSLPEIKTKSEDRR